MGVVSGLRVIGWAIVLLLMVVYAIGVVMRHLSAQQMRNEVRGMIMMSMHLRKFCWRSTAGAENVCVWRWGGLLHSRADKHKRQEFETVLAAMFTCQVLSRQQQSRAFPRKGRVDWPGVSCQLKTTSGPRCQNPRLQMLYGWLYGL